MKKKGGNNAGLLITVIFHLTVIIVMLIHQIHSEIRREESFVIDFTKQEELERIEKEQQEEIERLEREIAMKEEVMKNLQSRINDTRSTAVRNVPVNRGSQLKDDRGTDAEELYKEAEELAKRLRDGHELPEDTVGPDDDLTTAEDPIKTDGSSEQNYSGASVLEWELDGRQARSLPVPAFKCYGGGQVTVIIYVDRNGKVVDAKVGANDSGDGCLAREAVNAAKRSRFSRSETADDPQVGRIVYQFIAQ